MNIIENEISYSTTNSYSTLNTLTKETKRVWFVCHGMGYLSRYFLKYFEGLNPSENYIIAPQAQSKYYIPPKFKHVGASWLTKENTIRETENVMRYFDSIFENEDLPNHLSLIVLGYSQGVSVAMRYIAQRQKICDQLILMSGGIPKELKASDFAFTSMNVQFIYGSQDEYIDDERLRYEHSRAKELFGEDVTIKMFDGNHMVNTEIINRI